jgi:hypothetical protein
MTDPKRIDGAEVLSRVSGLPKAEVDAIWQQVQANKKLLDSCPRHDVKPLASSLTGGFFREYRCDYCGGKVSAGDARWYQRGLEHGRRPT